MCVYVCVIICYYHYVSYNNYFTYIFLDCNAFKFVSEFKLFTNLYVNPFSEIIVS